MNADAYHDTREMRFDLPDDLPPHLTPKGKRPMRPKWLRISYSINYPAGRASIHVDLAGRKVENDARYGRPTIGDVVRRSFGTPWAATRPVHVPATFDELGLPEWARPYVEDNRPSWCPAVGA